MPAIHTEELIRGKRLLEGAGHGERAAILQQLTRLWGCSTDRVYKYLETVGWSSGRKKRADAGQSVVTPADALLLAEWRAMNVRKNGKLMSDIAQAKDVLWRTGKISESAFQASDATWARVLRSMGYAADHLTSASLAMETDALHPNHRHQFDATIGVLYYLDRGGMKFRRLGDMDPKNKPQQFSKAVFGRQLLIRWALVDVYSGAFYVDYSLSAGENTADLLDFLWAGWSKKSDPRFPFHGVPLRLEGDQAGPNGSDATEAVCEALGIHLHLHTPSPKRDDAPGSRAKGAVEGLMAYWEREMESLWRSDPPRDLETIRRQSFDMCIALQSDPARTFRRTEYTRSQLWMEIKEEQVRTVPSLEVFRSLAVGKSEERTVLEHGWLNVGGSTYKIEHCTWYMKEKVRVRFDVWNPERLHVFNPRTGETLQAVKLTFKSNGKSTTAIIPGEADPELSSRQPLNPAAKLRMEVGEQVREKKGIAARGVWDTGLEHRADGVVVEFAPRVGRPAIAVELGRLVDDWDVLDLAVARLGRGLEPGESEWLLQQVKGRIPETEALAIIETLAVSIGERRQVLSFPGAATASP